MRNSRSSVSVHLALLLFCATNFANGDRELLIQLHRPVSNISRVERENPKWFPKRFLSNNDNKITRKNVNEKATNFPELIFGKKSFLDKNHRLLHRNRFRQATGKIKSFFEIVNHLPPTNYPSTKRNRRVTAITTEASSALLLQASNVVLFTRNNVTFPQWMINVDVVEARQRFAATPSSPNLRMVSYRCPTFGEMWYECTRPRNERHYPPTISRRPCTIRRGLTSRAFNYSGYLDRTRIYPMSMAFKCSSPASTIAFWRTIVDCPTASPRMPYEAYDKYGLFSGTFPATTGCCTDPTSTCSEPTSTEQETAWCTDPTSTPFLPRLYHVTRIDIPKPDISEQDISKSDIPKQDIPESNIPKLDIPKPDIPKLDIAESNTPKPDNPKPDIPKLYIPKLDIAGSNIPKQDVLQLQIPKPNVTKQTIPKPAARRAGKDHKSNIFTLIRNKCSCKCTQPTRTCTPPTSTGVGSNADEEPLPQQLIPCQCQTTKANTCACKQIVDPVISLTTGELMCDKEEKICNCKPTVVKPCGRHEENYRKAKCNCHCQKAKYNGHCQKVKSNGHYQKVKFSSHCHCQAANSNSMCQKAKFYCKCPVKSKVKRNVDNDELKGEGDFLIFKSIPDDWFSPSCLSSAISTTNTTGNPFNSVLVYLSWPDSQNRTKFSVEINGDGKSAATYLNTQFQCVWLLGGFNALLTVLFDH